jgi:hypothetical protein
MAAVIKAGWRIFDEWIIGKMGKYAKNFKARNCSSLYLVVTRDYFF